MRIPMTMRTSSLSQENLSAVPAPVTLKMNRRISFRIYEDTRPHCLEIASLQKGLILLHDDIELIEEGAGFGLPVVKYEDKAYFSSTAKIDFQQNKDSSTIVKTYFLDVVSRKKLGKSFVNDDFYGFLHKWFEKAYLARKQLAPAFDFIMELRKKLKVETNFVKADSRGTVKVTYSCFPDILKVRVDFSQLEKNQCQEIMVLNEQGSTFFTRYSDTDGTHLSNIRIGAWDKVKAEQAFLSDENETLSFSLKNIEPASLFRGWERIKGRFSWAGLGYLLPKNASQFNYDIQFKTKTKTKLRG